MRTTEKDLVMLTSKRGLRLNEILEILNTLRECLKYDYDFDIDEKKLVDGFRDIEVLNKYIYMSDVEFAKKMLTHIGITGDEIEEAVEEVINHYLDYEDEKELWIPKGTVLGLEDEEKEFKIVDMSNVELTSNIFVEAKVISYDFLLKMQSKLWNGILDDYYNLEIEEPYVAGRFESVQKYKEEYLEDVDCGDLLTELRNWALAHGFTVDDDDVQMICYNGEYIISFDIGI